MALNPTSLDAQIGDWKTAQPSDTPPQSMRPGVNISGPDGDGIVLILVTAIDGRSFNGARVPVTVLANHLRLAGWTVTPPEAK